jgi:acetyl/propionyl-CoA carboxylase alpha subunit
MVTGVDLVRAQLEIAGGARLPYRQEELSQRGHAIECRINAEDPAHDFAPSGGKILLARYPTGPGVRVDAGFETGDLVPVHYDSLLAKVIVHAETRAAAIRRMEQALERTAILGVATNQSFLETVLAHRVFRRGEATTGFLGRELAQWRPPAGSVPDEALAAMALAEVLAQEARGNGGPAHRDPDGDNASPWSRLDGYRVGGGE